MAQIGRLLASSALLLTATAAPPASADRAEEWAGVTCGFVSSNDATGIINPDPNAQFGVMNTGITLAIDLLDDDGIGLSPHIPLDSLPSITQHCWIQVNDSTYSTHGPIPTAHCDFTSVVNGVPGPVLMLPQGCTIAYSAGPTDSVFQCTTWTFEHDNMSEDYRWDDPSANAIHEDDAGYGTAQCALAISAGA